jgi:F0F1-type ATP synthase assembly protein I
MEPENERVGADETLNPPGDRSEGAETPDVSLPSHRNLPPPPVVDYNRPILKRGQYASRPDEHIGVSNEQNRINSVARLGSGLSAGITFASSVVVGVLIGMWLDKRFEPHAVAPWATIVMSVVGFVAGFMTFIRISSAADENLKKRK